MKEATLDPDKYPPLGPQDEALIAKGIHKAETTSLHSTNSANTQSSADDVPLDTSTFNPTKTFYILRHNLFSKVINVLDITGQTPIPYTGGDITVEFRDAARALAESNPPPLNPAYQVKRKHWYSSTASLTSPTSTSPTTELATWKHGAISLSTATLTFAPNSKHSPHPITMTPKKWHCRTNTFTLNSVPYTYKCDSRLKANRITLLKQMGGRNVVVARYVQKWGSWITGGVLLVDGRGLDEAVAVLSTIVMLRRMQQRAAERVQQGGGGGGGGE